MTITIYSSPSCARCKLAARMLDKDNVPYRYVDITVDDGAAAVLKGRGVTSLPYITWHDDSGDNSGTIEGFKHEDIKRLVASSVSER